MTCGLFHEKELTSALELMAWDCFPNCSFLWWWLTLYQPCNIGDRAVAASTVGLVSTGPLFEAPKLFLAHSTPTDWQLRVQLSSFKINAKMIATHVKASLPGPSDRPPTSQTFLHSSSKLSNSDNADCAFI